MKSLTLCALAMALIFAIAVGCGSSKSLASSEWRSQPVVVDGKPDEWQLPLRYANAATGLNFSISNDDQKLYFCFTTNEARTLGKITMGGLQIQVGVPGAAPATVLYPIPGTIQPERNSPKNKPQNKKKDWQLSQDAISLQVSGFPFAQATTELPLINKFGVNVGTDFGKDRFSYEASIPLEGLNLQGKDIQITITVKGVPKSQMKSGFDGMQQNSSVGAGGMRMGRQGYGSPGGGNRSGNSAYAAMFSDKKIKYSMRLASPQ